FSVAILFADEIFQADFVTRLIQQRKCRGEIADLGKCHYLLLKSFTLHDVNHIADQSAVSGSSLRPKPVSGSVSSSAAASKLSGNARFVLAPSLAKSCTRLTRLPRPREKRSIVLS